MYFSSNKVPGADNQVEQKIKEKIKLVACLAGGREMSLLYRLASFIFKIYYGPAVSTTRERERGNFVFQYSELAHQVVMKSVFRVS